MLQHSRRSLFDLTGPATANAERRFADAQTHVSLQDLAQGCSLGANPLALRGRSVMILTRRQLPAALALVHLDGIARRLVLGTPDLPADHLLAAVEDAEVDTIVSDGSEPSAGLVPGVHRVSCTDRIMATALGCDRTVDTEWVLFTSGTAGGPKLVVHTLASLVGPLSDGPTIGDPATWSTFYDVRRYGGLQILLRALVGHGSMVFSDPSEPVAAFLGRVGNEKVTHISGTPSHWRRALMSAATDRMQPGYVRLSGEIVGQAILDALRQAFPTAGIAHAFASTEAGVAFDVRDGRAGFPASLINEDGAVKLRVIDGTLRIKSARTARRYLGANMAHLRDAEGFVDTGDLVEISGDRCHFHGRRGGIINVGGLKVHPETVEAVINQHPNVLMSRVSARSSPITGAIVVAEIVARSAPDAAGDGFKTTKDEILALCRTTLASHQVPALLKQVASLEIAASGKLVRRHA